MYGSVRGNVRAKGKIEIKKNGSVNGDLTTPQIIIEDGAYFKGSIEIEKSAGKEGDKNVSSRRASTPVTRARRTEEYLITKVEYIFLFVVCRAIILPMHMAKGVLP